MSITSHELPVWDELARRLNGTGPGPDDGADDAAGRRQARRRQRSRAASAAIERTPSRELAQCAGCGEWTGDGEHGRRTVTAACAAWTATPPMTTRWA